MSESDDGAQIIVFPTIPGSDAIGPPAEVKEKRRWTLDGCQHRKHTLDMEAHRMRCSDCDQEIDCFDWIVEYARKWARFNTEYRQAIRQAADATKRVAVLERIEKNTKARIRKHGVLLTSGQARRLRDQYQALMSALDHAYRERLQDEDSRHKLRNELRLFGIDFDKLRPALRPLSDQLDLRETEETA